VPLESKPRNPLSAGYKPPGGTPYRVQDGDDWNSVARKFGVNVQALIMFNFNTLNTNEINWYLRTLLSG
jgi:LysM repeat protein